MEPHCNGTSLQWNITIVHHFVDLKFNFPFLVLFFYQQTILLFLYFYFFTFHLIFRFSFDFIRFFIIFHDAKECDNKYFIVKISHKNVKHQTSIDVGVKFI